MPGPGRSKHLRLQFRERTPEPQIHFFPVIETGTLQLPIINRETERLDQMQP